MINLISLKNQKLNNSKVIEILFYTFPLSFILGNLILSLHLIVFIIFSFFFIRREKLSFRFKYSYWVLVIFCIYLIVTTIIQFMQPGMLNEALKYWSFESNPIFKSIIFVRFIVLIFIIDIFLINKIIDLKKIFLFSLLCTTFVSFDIILQYITGYDLFGYERELFNNPTDRRNSGPFGDEMIAGSYLQRFSFFSLFYFFTIFQNKNLNITSSIFIFVLHAVAILLSGNRMPLILFLFGFFLVFILVKKLRFVVFSSVIIFLAILFVIIKNDQQFNTAYQIFFDMSKKSYTYIFKTAENNSLKPTKTEDSPQTENNVLIKKNKKRFSFLRTTGHGNLWQSAIFVWQQQPLFGFGLKSFRVKCWKGVKWNNAVASDKLFFIVSEELHDGCSTHPHNYYFELLSEVGIVGVGLLLIFFLIILKDSFHSYINKKEKDNLYLLMPLIIVFLLEIWPFKSTGSFFTTWNATFIWLNIAMLIGYLNQKKN